MGLYNTTFPNKIGHGTTLGRSFRRLRVLTKILWGLGCQIYLVFLEWKGLYTRFFKKNVEKSPNPISHQVLVRKMDFLKKVQRPK